MTRLLVASASAVALAAGCGESGARLSKNEYLDQIRALEFGDLARDATRAFDQMALDDSVLPQAECAAKARRLHEDLDGIIDEVDALRPPAEVQDVQDEFVSAGRKTVDTVGDLAQEIESGKLACGRAFNQRAYGLPSTAQAQRAIEELGRRGYLIGHNSD